jgi:leucyl aminopeptidase
LTTLRLADTDPREVRAAALIVGVAKGRSGPVLLPGAERLEKAFRGGLRAALAGLGATGKADEVTRLATLGAIRAASVVAVGVGEVAGGEPSPETLRRAAGCASRALAGTSSAATVLALGGASRVRPVAEGLLLGAYRFGRYRTHLSTAENRKPLGSATLLVSKARDAAARAELNRAAVIAESVALCRDLVNTPAGDLHPADLAATARSVGTEHGLAVSVMDDKALARGGFGGILGVGQGSVHPPRLVRVAHRAGRNAPTVALIGKGITFDSGGLSLKPAQSMETMKSDMGGAAAVLASVVAAARLELPVNVTGWMPTAENMPSGTAIRPADVLHIYGGRTVEVLNTDAEGRLILADAIVRAAEENPDSMIDLATLTGAQLVALGSRTFAVMGNDDAFRATIVAAAEQAGEAAWPMPLPEELRKSLDSEVADIANIGDRNGGMLVAGIFLKEFVPDGLPWAHLDIAGPAYNTAAAHGYTPKGGTGAGVRTVVGYLESLAG